MLILFFFFLNFAGKDLHQDSVAKQQYKLGRKEMMGVMEREEEKEKRVLAFCSRIQTD